MEALPVALASKLRTGMDWRVLEELLIHRKLWLQEQGATPKTWEEINQLWGQEAENRWLLGLQAHVEKVLHPEISS
jgi:hypothetical protein